ncbi:unnamed protein product [Callosobruchus maculatus]|uniref:Uncharacterized protein n=1 Tax=Callosobruchus maculatus TaxID=64391 RepID=A0A653CWE7_CALMS|nr:unnamed protein product [Callosobruchus maculatus]
MLLLKMQLIFIGTLLLVFGYPQGGPQGGPEIFRGGRGHPWPPPSVATGYMGVFWIGLGKGYLKKNYRHPIGHRVYSVHRRKRASKINAVHVLSIFARPVYTVTTDATVTVFQERQMDGVIQK